MSVFQLIFVPGCSALAVFTLVRGFRGHLGARQTLFWAALWSMAAVAIAFPSLAGTVAIWLGIGRGADLVFYGAVLAGLATSLYFYHRFRRLELLCTELVRHEAIRQATRGAPRPAEHRSS